MSLPCRHPLPTSQPHCLGHLQYSLPPFGDPGLDLTLLYSTGTARSSSAANLRRKGIALLAVVLTLVCSSQSVGFALPPAPEPIEINQARSKPGGFLRGPFQVGSGATGSDPELPQETPVTEGTHLKSPGGSTTSATQRLLSSTVVQKIFTHQVSYLASAGVAAAILAILVHMMAGAAAPAPATSTTAFHRLGLQRATQATASVLSSRRSPCGSC